MDINGYVMPHFLVGCGWDCLFNLEVMVSEFKGTPGPWIVDVRNGCVAVYPDGEQDETPGCHRDDLRNIAYSNKGAEYDKVVGFWSMDRKTIHDYRLISAAPELLEALQWAMKRIGGYSQRTSTNSDYCDSIDRANAAIAKALGESQ